MNSTTQQSKMQTSNPFRKIDVAKDKRSITMYGKKDATWEQMNDYLEMLYGKDKHMNWRGFGEVGTEEFTVILVRRPCWEKPLTCAYCDSDGEEESDYEDEDDE